MEGNLSSGWETGICKQSLKVGARSLSRGAGQHFCTEGGGNLEHNSTNGNSCPVSVNLKSEICISSTTQREIGKRRVWFAGPLPFITMFRFYLQSSFIEGGTVTPW